MNCYRCGLYTRLSKFDSILVFLFVAMFVFGRLPIFLFIPRGFVVPPTGRLFVVSRAVGGGPYCNIFTGLAI